MDIVKFFKAWDADHCRAYLVFVESGEWPEGFLPAEVDASDCGVRLAEAIALKHAVHVVEEDDDLREREARHEELRAIRRAEIASKPKLAEVPGLMRSGWRLFAGYGMHSERPHWWLSKGTERLGVSGNTAAALLRRKLVRVGRLGTMSRSTEYLLAD